MDSARRIGGSLPYVFPHTKNQLPDKWVKITSKKTGKSVIAPIVDVGPHSTNNPYWTDPKGDSTSGNKKNKSGLDMTPATGAALGLPVFHGRGHNPISINLRKQESLCIRRG